MCEHLGSAVRYCECPARGARHSATHLFAGIEHRHRERGAWDSKKLFRRARIESNPQRNPQRCKRRGFVRNDVHGNDVGDGSWGDGSGQGRIIFLVQDEKDLVAVSCIDEDSVDELDQKQNGMRYVLL